jgi:hypothetical protein
MRLSAICGLFGSTTFLGALAKFAKNDYLALTYLSFRLSIRLEQLGSHWADFHEIWYLSNCRKPVDIFRVSLK